MDIEVSNLTKKYHQQLAVDNLSFSSEGKEIIGFLGPNGAGKSTTMKMLTGYLTPDGGHAKVAGYDAVSQSREVKSIVGYLPESNPLYYDMYVREFLQFIAKAHRLSNINSRVSEVIETVGLEKEAHKTIRQLSKGYKQRVGLAQAIIHDPQVLILDEPTSGLDANQLLEVRSLIKQLGKDKTILFSSHIMQEVEALCERVLIIDDGRLVVDSDIRALADLVKSKHRIMVEFLHKPKDLKPYRKLGDEVLLTNGGTFMTITTKDGKDIRADIFRLAVRHGDVIIGMQQKNQSVESIFQKLTRKS